MIEQIPERRELFGRLPAVRFVDPCDTLGLPAKQIQHMHVHVRNTIANGRLLVHVHVHVLNYTRTAVHTQAIGRILMV